MTYFEYLKDIIGVPYDNHDYDDLLKHLLEMDFDVVNEYPTDNDYNRVADGLALRNEYSFETCNFVPKDSYFERSILNHPCSVLEVLVALARRIENDFMYDPSEGDRTGLWMRVMLDNLGIGQYQGTLSPEAISEVESRCRTMMKRTYDFDGRGGLFPLEKPNEDQRYIQIWDQMRVYLRENYL